MYIMNALLLCHLISGISALYINQILEGPCTLPNMFHHALDNKMISSVCDTTIDGNCSINFDYTINGVSFYVRENSRNITLCGVDKLNKEYITTNDIETQLL
eukprot:526296_1